MRVKDALTRKFDRLVEQLAELLEKTDDPAAHRATAVALLHHKISGASWTGFYLLKDGDLIVDAYQGPVACLVLERHTGVCWGAIDKGATVVVEDVHAFPDHIACDERSQSEVVVPIRDGAGTIIGVLDIDSHLPGHFGQTHARGYEAVVQLLERTWAE